MKYTQYLIMELGTRCNLGDVHTRCPNRHPERYSRLPKEGPVSMERKVEIAEHMYREEGFRGHIGFHYYNEPLVDMGLMFDTMDAISSRVPEATYTLWTNGTLLPEDCSQFRRFSEIHITDYQLPEHPIQNLRRLTDAVDICPIVHRGRLDDRLHAIGNTDSRGPCNRMFTEFIIDYHGNVHLCCYEWKGSAAQGNVMTKPLALLVDHWQSRRWQVSGSEMREASWRVCLRCKMRSTHIPQFIPEIAEKAREQCQV